MFDVASNRSINTLLFLQVMITAAGMEQISQVCSTVCVMYLALCDVGDSLIM